MTNSRAQFNKQPTGTSTGSIKSPYSNIQINTNTAHLKPILDSNHQDVKNESDAYDETEEDHEAAFVDKFNGSQSFQPSVHSPTTPNSPLSLDQWIALKRCQNEGSMHMNHLGDLGSSNDNSGLIENISIPYLYQPHTLTAFLFILITLCYTAATIDPSTNSPLKNLRIGVTVASAFVLMIGLLIFPSGPFIRPHPLFWRAAFGVGLLYEMFLILLLFSDIKDARESLIFFDQKLGKPLEERAYAEQCDFNYTNFKSGFLDIYALSHFIGWIIKSLMIRDRLICWIISISWEMIEIVFTYMMPNFAECWWDQWLLDVLICNGLGIEVGYRLCSLLEMQTYQWRSFQQYQTWNEKIKRFALQFTPKSWTRVRWEKTKNVKIFLGIQVLIIMVHMEELNAFFLKHILWIPPPRPLNTVRLFIWVLLGPSALRQCYSWLTDEQTTRLGTHTFLSGLILFTELMVIIKLGKQSHEFDDRKMPTNVKFGLVIGLTVYFCYVAWVVISILVRKPHYDALSNSQTASPNVYSPQIKTHNNNVSLIRQINNDYQNRYEKNHKSNSQHSNENTEIRPLRRRTAK